MNKAQNALEWRKDPHAVQKYQFVYHFLPHPQEQRRATLLLNKSIFVYCLLIVSASLVFRLVAWYLPGVLGYASNINTADLLTFTNNRRVAEGLPTLSLNENLSRAAAKKAQHMFKKSYWAHIAPDGTEPWDFILSEGYDYIYAGENLAKNFSNSKDVVQAWYNSPSHRDNLLKKEYKDVGFAEVNGVLNGYETTLVVQMFGSPRYVQAPNNKPQYEKQSETAVPDESPVKEINTQIVQQPTIFQEIDVAPTIDVRKATKTLSLLFAGFVVTLLVLDFWYSKKLGIVKINGHTLAHIALLFVVMLSIWFVLKPGSII